MEDVLLGFREVHQRKNHRIARFGSVHLEVLYGPAEQLLDLPIIPRGLYGVQQVVRVNCSDKTWDQTNVLVKYSSF